MKSVGVSLWVLVLWIAAAARVDAQMLPGISLSVEARPALGVPIGEFAGSDEGIGAGSGVGISAGASLGFGPAGVYGEYQLLRFACGDCEAAGLDDRAEDQGWEAGGELRVPLGLVGLRPWIRAGVVGHQLRLSGQGGSIVSEPTLGWGAGAGVTLPLPVPLPMALEASPAVRFRSYTAEYQFEQLELPARETPVSYLSLELGIALRF